MKITFGKLRQIIREAVVDTAITPYIRNAMAPTSDDREPIERMSLKDIDGNEEIAPHLRNADMPDVTDDAGPVPPRNGEDELPFHAQLDPYNKNWHASSAPVGR